MKKVWALTLLILSAQGCGSVRTILSPDSDKDKARPISNPFAFYSPESQKVASDTLVLRSKRGDGAVEVEIPNSSHTMSDFVIPIASNKKNPSRAPAAALPQGMESEVPPAEVNPEAASVPAVPTQEPTLSDREITRTFPQAMVEDEARRREIEKDLGLVRAEEMTPEKQTSYLAALDHVKQLYRTARYEAALLEIDGLVREYPTNPKLYEMRGTLLDRVGQLELAIKAWKQALRFDAKNEPLRRFIERKEQRRSLASP